MGRDEQVEEREVLDAIFPDEITDISETEYTISIKLDIPDDEEANDPPVMLLTVRYPSDYPDQAPDLDLSPEEGSAPHPLLDVSGDKAALLAGLAATVEENLGMAMVFALVTTLKEQAEQLVVSRREEAARAREEAILAAEREENKKFHGTPVTRETFLRWREGFVREEEERRAREEEERAAEMKKARIREPVRLTGRQLWERGLAKGEEGEEEEGGGEDGPVGEMDRLKVSAS